MDGTGLLSAGSLGFGFVWLCMNLLLGYGLGGQCVGVLLLLEW